MTARPTPAEALHRAAQALGADHPFALLAIDGRCGSGKTTLAETLRGLPCQIIHTDDFYLPPTDRIPNWAETPAANMDFTRLLAELLQPLRAGQNGVYRPYSCRAACYGQCSTVTPAGLVVVEGSYALHPVLRDLYDYRVFVSCDQTVQTQRLQQREGPRFADFAARWIPLEEGYFAACAPAAHCDLLLDSTDGL